MSEDKGEDRGGYDHNGRYNVSIVNILDINRRNNDKLEKIVFSKQAITVPNPIYEPNYKHKILGCQPSTWHGCLRNAPGVLSERFPLQRSGENSEDIEDEKERSERIGRDHVVVVELRNIEERKGPGLVLQGLRYRGNIGTIVRTAVQCNFFERLVMIDPDFDPEAHNNSRVAEKDLEFYSMCNSVLLNVDHYGSVEEFRESPLAREEGRPWLAAALVPGSVNLYSRSATPLLSSLCLRSGLLFMGSEGLGLPQSIVGDSRCRSVMIPAMSASVNVGVAFGMVMAAVLMRRAEGEDEDEVKTLS